MHLNVTRSGELRQESKPRFGTFTQGIGPHDFAKLQGVGGGLSSNQMGQQLDLAAALELAVSLQAQLQTCMFEKGQLQAELAAEKANTAAVQFQCDSFSQLACHFAQVGCSTLSLSKPCTLSMSC
jgi:hypothetical protein